MKMQLVMIAMSVLSSVSAFAAAGGSVAPVPNTNLVSADSAEIVDAMSSYDAVEKFKIKVMMNGVTAEHEIHFVIASRFEPDAPIPNNLLIVKSEDNYPEIFNAGRITIDKIKQTGLSQFELSGNGGYWYGYKGACEGKWVFVNRTIQINFKQKLRDGEPASDVQPVFGKVTDVESCN